MWKLSLKISCENESTEIRITQKIGKGRGNSYQKVKKFPGERHIQTHGSLIELFR